MEEASAELFTFLIAQSVFADVMGNKLFPVVAGPNVTGRFATYRILRKDGISKDAKSYDITLFLWFSRDEYKNCVQFTDKIDPIIENSAIYDWQSSTVDYNEDLQIYVGIINFNKN